jgi:hypothetical protein
VAELDQITAATKRYVRANPKLVDMVFQQGPVIAYAKQNLRQDYDGGRLIGENFYYGGLPGGSYAKGKQFNISQPQVEQQLQFQPKFFEVAITLYKEDIQVINRGPAAALKLLDSRVNNAFMTIGAHLEIAMFLNGQTAGYTTNFNGLPEALNDNITMSWDNNLYATYGTITRGGATGTVLNSPPTNLAAGSLEYPTLEETYGDASFGALEPNLGVTTAKGYSYIKEHFQTQQRFNDTQDPKIGFRGLKFNDATLVKSRYCPGSWLTASAGPVYNGGGTNDPIATGYLSESSSPGSASPGTVTAYPVGNLGNTGESLWWLNARNPFMNFYMSPDPEYSFGLTGFIPGQGNTIVVAKLLFAGAMTWAPRYHRQIYGFTS